jgi:hypothetical protein
VAQSLVHLRQREGYLAYPIEFTLSHASEHLTQRDVSGQAALSIALSPVDICP